jgi:putative ABC transport system ATP-binding protein
MSVLQFERVSKAFFTAGRRVDALSDISLQIGEGERCTLVGPSGSGKSSLLGLAAGLDRADSGAVRLCGKDLSTLAEDDCAEWRNLKVGFVYQSYQLLPGLTAWENVMLPLEIRALESVSSIRDLAATLLDEVGLADRRHHYPAQLSGGEQQRVSLARAFASRPEILLADEPTGSLDAKNADHALELMFRLNDRHRTALLVVTHDLKVAERFPKRFQLEHGRLAAC